jgi:hypothetical protein
VVKQTPSPTVRAVGIAIGVSVLLGLLVSWFAWPAKELEPRNLPIVVAGPAPATAALSQQLAAVRPDAFEVTTVADASAADQALKDRKAYAAFVIGADGPSLHTASAASPTVAALLTQAAQQLGGGRPVAVVDVVPGAPEDPRGAGFGSGFLPLVLASMVGGILLAVVIPRWRDRLIGLAAFAVVGGLVGAGVMHWLGVIGGSYWAAAAVIALLALAVSSTVCGLSAVLGAPGIGLGVLVVFLFGNPISGVVAAPELLPTAVGRHRAAAAGRCRGHIAAVGGVLRLRRRGCSTVDVGRLGCPRRGAGERRPYPRRCPPPYQPRAGGCSGIGCCGGLPPGQATLHSGGSRKGGTDGQRGAFRAGLTKRFGTRVAFEDVSFQVGGGEVFGFSDPTVRARRQRYERSAPSSSRRPVQPPSPAFP